MVFGACCERQYGFVYDGVRAHGGLAWFPLLSEDGKIHWERNPRYKPSELKERRPRKYLELQLRPMCLFTGSTGKSRCSAVDLRTGIDERSVAELRAMSNGTAVTSCAGQWQPARYSTLIGP